MTDIVIADALRTAIGKFGGSRASRARVALHPDGMGVALAVER